MDFSLQTIVLWAVPVVFAITLHEAAHGYVARMFGDRTAELQGRITLNPLKHIDPVGTILVPGRVDPGGEARRSAVRVRLGEAGAGQFRQPAQSQARHAVGRGGRTRGEFRDGGRCGRCCSRRLVPAARCASAHWLLMAKIGISVNLVLMALNLLPVPPLDGGRIAVSLLPHVAPRARTRASSLTGCSSSSALLAFGVLDDVMRPLLRARRMAAAGVARPLSAAHRQPSLSCFPIGCCRACGPPGACTSAITMARSRTGSGCRRSTSACSSPPTGTR